MFMGKKKHIPPDGIPGEIVVTDTLDLHGFFPEQVEELVSAFLKNAGNLGLKHLRIVHGKGRSRLKWEVVRILKNHDSVYDFKDAPPDMGGWGSTVVRLK